MIEPIKPFAISWIGFSGSAQRNQCYNKSAISTPHAIINTKHQSYWIRESTQTLWKVSKSDL